LADSDYRVLRPVVSSPSAKIEIAGSDEALRLPVMLRDETAGNTYDEWIMERLGLPILEVPRAPTKPESEPVPVTINDYLLYCLLAQHEIDSSVFGHSDVYKNIKRKYVFEIIYGLYSLTLARLQEEYRDVDMRTRQARQSIDILGQLLVDTPWANRALLQQELDATKNLISDLEQSARRNTQALDQPQPVARLRQQVIDLDFQLAGLRTAILDEQRGVEQLEVLLRQLQTESSRITRSIVAGEYLLDFDFKICPRCGLPVDSQRTQRGGCYLCCQEGGSSISRDAMIEEQDRVGAQILETQDLIAVRRESLLNLRRNIEDLEAGRRQASSELDFQSQIYLSDSATAQAETAAQRARLYESRTRLADYLTLYTKHDETALELSRLEQRRQELLAQMEAESHQEHHAEEKIRYLEHLLDEILDKFQTPRFCEQHRATIDRDTYLPIVDGRRFNQLSSQGLQVLVNLAHAIAHQLTALEFGLALPGILLIDGPTSNLGHEYEDRERVEAVYQYLIELGDRLGDRLQLIVVDNDVPAIAQSYIQVRLTDEDRLVPTSLE
jgi:hypothetical protein